MTLLRSEHAVLLLLLALLPTITLGFLRSLTCGRPSSVAGARCRRWPRLASTEDDDLIDPNTLGDWRAFRMNLANAGMSSAAAVSVDSIDLEGTNETLSTGSAAITSSPAAATARPKSVSKRNEKLLGTQNVALAEEYLNGVWAHESALPEVGGLVCRMPLEVEIYRSGDSGSVMSKNLRELLDLDGGTEDSSPATSLSSSASSGVIGSASSAGVYAEGIRSRLSEDSVRDEGDGDDPFSALAARTVFWYRGAERLLKREIVKITSRANANGKIEANDLDEASLELLQLYMEHQQTWQEVCLILERDERTGCAKTVTINRPMAFKLSESVGRLVLLGAHEAQGGATVSRREGNGREKLVKFLGAFENECGVYVGGTDGMDLPAVMIHGIDGLPGSTEISPGTGIYKGGLEAAMDGVLSGKYKPLDFRFFIGHTKYVGGELDGVVARGKYQPVACSRPLVLKQCIQLPKPLWHEVLEFCGGELKEISKLELAKRDDLK